MVSIGFIAGGEFQGGEGWKLNNLYVPGKPHKLVQCFGERGTCQMFMVNVLCNHLVILVQKEHRR